MIGEVNADFKEWLKRSLVCTTKEPKDLATLTSAIIHGYGRCTKICALSCFKYILTYPIEEAMKEAQALNNQEELKLWFYDFQRWSRYDSCETRKVWLEVFGVPPRGWSWENYNGTSGLWGKLITLGKSIAHTKSFESMKMLIATNVFTWIEEEILLTLEDEGHRVIVTEIAPTFQQYISGKPNHITRIESN